MKLRLVIVLTALLGAQMALPARAQVNFCSTGERSTVTAEPRYPYGAHTKVYSLESRTDGAAIQIGLVRPEVPKGKRVPVIVRASPYFPALQTVNIETCDRFLVENFVPQGYAVALVAVRGTADSGGCFDLFGPRERADLDQAVRWLGTRSWSNGAVGMIGKSYDGGTPWMVAASGNRHLKTIVPVSGVPDVFDLLFGSGSVDWRGPGLLSGLYYGRSIASVEGRAPERTVEATACPDYAVGEAASVYSSFTGEPDPFGYWDDRRYVDDILRRYRGSVFLVQGLVDWNVNPGAQFPLITGLQRRGVVAKMMLGQWGHSQPDEVSPPSLRRDYADILLRWFDRWLKGNRGVDVGPPVQVEDSTGRWRNESAWPPASRRMTFWLGSDGTLASKPGNNNGTVLLAPDPMHLQDPASAQGAGVGELPVSTDAIRDVCAQPSCAAFETTRFAKTFRIAGLPSLRLSVVPMGLAGGLSVQLYGRGPDGLTHIGWGHADLRFPKGGVVAQPVQPGEPLDVDLELQPLDAVVGAGESLVAMISMTNAYNRLPSLPAGPVVLEVGAKTSGLQLVNVTPSTSQFFRPRR